MLKTSILAVILSCSFMAHAGPRKPVDCGALVSTKTKLKDRQATETLIAYLEDLVREAILNKTHLAILQNSLNGGKFQSPISEKEASLSATGLIHRQGLEEFAGLSLDIAYLKEWTDRALGVQTQTAEEKIVTAEATTSMHIETRFHRLQPGSVLVSAHKHEDSFEDPKEQYVTLLQAIEVMNTPVTQYQWVELMGYNPSVHKTGVESYATKSKVTGKMVTLQPNNPVENIHWWAALHYANKLSIRHGLKPVYKFEWKKVNFEAAEKRRKRPFDKDDIEVIIDAPNGDIYKAEGYRLPTVAEQMYLYRNMGLTETRFTWGNEEEDLIRCAWLENNSRGTTQPVASLDPVEIDGKEFYDLFGNVSEFSYDVWSGEKPFKFTINPLGTGSMDEKCQARGGNFQENHYGSDVTSYTGFSRYYGTSYVGFRLVRTVP